MFSRDIVYSLGLKYTLIIKIACTFLALINSIILMPVASCDNITNEFARETIRFKPTNTWVVRFTEGLSKIQSLAVQLGFQHCEKVSDELPHLYLLRNPTHPKGMRIPEEYLLKRLREKREISWVRQQSSRKVIPATASPGLHSSTLHLPKKGRTYPRMPANKFGCLEFNDKYWPKQYYIQNCRNPSRWNTKSPHDLNVVPVWTKYGIFGKNIKVIVVDQGVYTKHVDLVDNYDRSLGLDLVDNDTSPEPVTINLNPNSHGTKCAGIIAMKANNSICGVGIAPQVTLGAVRLLVGNEETNDVDGAKALLFKHREIHISSNSWSFSDTGDEEWEEFPLVRAALKIGGTKGRRGKGVIYVVACGSQKSSGRNCSSDPLRVSIYTIPVASCDYRGKITYFSERCSNVMVTTYGTRVVATDRGRKACTGFFAGTSASTPMVSGAIALALEANPNLHLRDVQHLLAWTSRVAPLQNNRHTWKKNGAGFYVSHDFGFGLLDINGLVEKAIKFPNVGPMNSCVAPAKLHRNDAKFHDHLQVEIVTDGCKGNPAEVVYLEHVQLTLSLTYPRRGDVEVHLVSPSGVCAMELLVLLLQPSAKFCQNQNPEIHRKVLNVLNY